MISLLHAGLLPWVAAIAIPVAIHLLTRKTRREMDLPTLRFLQRTVAQQSNLFRWRHWLLLALRALAVLALALAFTRPQLDSALALPANQRVGVVAVLDVSASMGYSAGGLSSLARAKGEALKVLQQLKSGDRANIIICAAQPSALMTEPISDIAAVQSAVRRVEPSEERGDPTAAINLAVEQLAKTEAPVKQLYVFSDFQRTDWAEAKLDSVPAAVRRFFINTDAGSRDNVGLTALRLRPSTPRAGQTFHIEAEAFNASGGIRTAPIALTLSNGARYVREATLPPYSSATVSFPLRFETPERLECTATLPSDHLIVDNSRFSAVDLRRDAVVVLLTDENPDEPPAASFFLTQALNPGGKSGAGFRVLPTRPAELNNPLLHGADVVVVCNAPSMPSQQFEALARYVTAGGNLIWYLYGDGIRQQIEGVASRLPAAEPMPLQVEEVTNLTGNGKGFVTLAEARYESPLLRAFRDPDASDLTKVRFSKLCITSEVDDRAEVLLKFEDGTAAAVRAGEGSGNLLLLNIPPAPAWNDLARQECFLPLMHEFLKGIISRDSGLRDSYPGGAASATLPTSEAALQVRCTGPNGSHPALVKDPTTGSVVIERTPKAGFYRLAAGGKPAGVIAVNPHPDESDLRSLDPRELEARRNRQNSVLEGQAGREADVSTLGKGVPLWQLLLIAALLCLFGEQCVSRLRPRVSQGQQGGGAA